MRILVTGSRGHLGEALMRTLRGSAHEAIGIDIIPSPYTDRVGSIVDRAFVRTCMRGTDAVLHAATLHKPHVATHSRRQFVEVNVSGTLNLLEEATAANVRAFVFTSTTSTFGRAMMPGPDDHAVWITEEVVPVPKNIYGVTKVAAEDLCELFARNLRLPVVVLRTSRFFPEEDDHKERRDSYADANLKANEFLYRRVDVADIVDAHLLAIEKAPSLGFRKFIVSATSPFSRADLAELHRDAPAVVRRYAPDYVAEYARRGWKMLPSIDRVYVNERARTELCWRPKYDFAHVIARLRANEHFTSPLARAIGSKGYHAELFDDGPYPVERTS
jgi:UDP-glucose 4-epimerase